MVTLRYLRASVLAAALVAIGCQSAWLTAAGERPATPSATPPARPRPATSLAGHSAKAGAAEPVDESLLVGLMDKLQAVSELDPTATPRLLAELQGMPPKFWPAAAEQFRASLAYHKQLAAREGNGTRAAGVGDLGSATADLRFGTGDTRNDADDSAMPGSKVMPPSAVEPTVKLASLNDVTNSPHAAKGQQVPALVPSPQPRAPASSTTDWREMLTATADDLDRRAAPSPISTAEVHEHVIERTLRLLAGDTERALEPIPGISPIEQDYWSRQLFALGTYLDHHEQPDDKRRAAAAAVHLDEALSSLREVGALSLCNVAFCKKVHGYGAYEAYESARFSPGQALALYVEVENYHSLSTDKGFTTSLASSYEILDADGQRVAGDSFPDVNDTCRSRRRDFHIQYGLSLPAKIAPGKYRLQLVIRDRQSDKIGNTSVAFEVAGEKQPVPTGENQKPAN